MKFFYFMWIKSAYFAIKMVAFSYLPVYASKTQARGFAPIGMVECWNIGIMGLGILQYWVNSENRHDLKLKWTISFENPVFHRSPIPLFHD
jgi:hypothetical protein